MKKIVLVLMCVFVWALGSMPVHATENPEKAEVVEGQSEKSPAGEDFQGAGADKQSVLVTGPQLFAADLENHLQEEIVEKRNASSKHYRNDEDTYTAVFYQGPVHYKKSEVWEEIDTRIVSLDEIEVERVIGKEKKNTIYNEGYSHGTFKNSFQLHFSKNANRPVRIALEDGWIAFQPIGGKNSRGEFMNNQVLYPDVWPNADLRYTSRNTGLKEEIIVKSSEHPASFGFRIQLHNVDYQQHLDGRILFLNRAGEVEAWIPRGFMEDANGEISENVEMVIEKKGNNLVLTLVPDEAWLTDASRAYPVVIDPTVNTFQLTVKDAYVTDHWSNIERGEKEHLEVGYNSYVGWKTSYTYIQFFLDGLPPYLKVSESKVQLYMHHEPDPAPVKGVSYLVTQPWIEDEINWNNQPTWGESTPGYYMVDVVNGYNDFILDTDWLVQWVRDPDRNYGVCFQGIDEEIQNLKHFRSREYNNTAVWPKLYFTYDASFRPVSPAGEEFYNQLDSFEIVASDPTYRINNWPAKVLLEKIDATGNVLSKIDEYTVTISDNQFDLQVDLVPGRYQWKVKDNKVYSIASVYGPSTTFYYDNLPPELTEEGWADEPAFNVNEFMERTFLFATLAWHPFEESQSESGFDYSLIRYRKTGDNSWTVKSKPDGTEERITTETLSMQVSFASEYEVQIMAYDKAKNATTWLPLGTFQTPPKPSKIVKATIRNLTSAWIDFDLHNYTEQYNIKWKRTDVEGDAERSTGWFADSRVSGTARKNISFDFEPHGWYQFSIGTLAGGLESWVSADPVQVPNSVPIPPVLDSPKNFTALRSGEKIHFSAKDALPNDIDGDPVTYTIEVKDNISGDWVKSCAGPNGQMSLIEGDYRWRMVASDGTSASFSTENVFFVDHTPPLQPEFTFESVAGIVLPGVVGQNGSISYAINEPTVILRLDRYEREDEDGYPYPSDELKNNDVYEVEIEPGDLIYKKAELVDKNIPYTFGEGEGKYEIKIISRDWAGNESYRIKSITFDKTPPPTIEFPEADQHYFNSTTDSITFTWESVTDLPAQNHSGIAVYKVEVTHLTASQRMYTLYTSQTSCQVSGLESNEAVMFRVKAIDHVGNEGNYSEQLIWYPLPPVATVDSTKTKVSLVEPIKAPYQQKIELFINTVNCSYYKIFRDNLTTQEEMKEYAGPADGIFTELVGAGQTYRYRVVTYNSKAPAALFSESQYTIEIQNHVPTTPTVSVAGRTTTGYLPLAMTTITATSIDYDNNDLHYEFRFKKNQSPVILEDLDQTANTCTLADLENGAEYEVIVTARDQVSSSEPSNPIRFTVDTVGPTINITPIANIDYVQSQVIQITATDGESGLESVKYRWISSETSDTVPVDEQSQEETLTSVPADGWISAPEGEMQLVVVARDVVGNQTSNLAEGNTTDSTYIYRVDCSGPVVQTVSVQGESYQGSTYVTSNQEVTLVFAFIEEDTEIASYRYGYLAEGERLLDTEIADLPEVKLSALSSYKGAQIVTGDFRDGQSYYPVVVVYDRLGNMRKQVSTTPFTVDGSVPVVSNLEGSGLVQHGSGFYLANPSLLSFAPICLDPETGIEKIQYGVSERENVEPSVWYQTFAELKRNHEFAEGNRYYLWVKATNGIKKSVQAHSAGFLVDTQKPVFQQIQGGTLLPAGSDGHIQTDNTAIRVSWVVEDASPLAQFYYKIGTLQGTGDVSQKFVEADQEGWVALDGVNQEDEVWLKRPGFSFANGSYYVTIKVVDAAGHTNTATTGEVKIDATRAAVPRVTLDRNFVYETDQLHFVIHLPNPEHTLTGYQYQILDANGTVLVDWQEITTSVQQYDVTHRDLQLINGQQYFVAVQAKYLNKPNSGSGWGNVWIDSTPPTNLIIHSPAYANTETLQLSWSGEEDISQIRYWAQVGRSGNTDDLQPLTLLGGIQQYTFSNLAAQNGDVVYVTLIAENSAGLTSVRVSNPIVIDNTPPSIPQVIDTGMYTNKDDQLQVSWTWSVDDPESGTDHYEVALVKARSVNVATEWTTVPATQKSYTFVQPLMSGEVYFVAVKAVNCAGLSSIGYSDGILVDPSKPDPPSIDDHLDFVAQVDALGRLTADVTGVDLQSGIQGYYYSLGTYAEPGILVDQVLIDHSRVLGGDGFALQAGEVYFFTAVALNNAGDISAASMSDGVMIVDGAKPAVSSIQDGGRYSLANDQLFFVWDINDPTLPVDHYEYCFAEDTEMAEEVWMSTYEKRAHILAAEVLGEGQRFEDGKTYYLAVRAVNKLQQPTVQKLSDGITIDTTPPAEPLLAIDSYVTSSLPLRWSAADVHSGIVKYEYAAGTSRGGDDLTGGWQTIDLSQLGEQESSNSIHRMINTFNMIDSTTYYLTVRAQNGAGLWSNLVMSDGFTADLSAPTTPVVTVSAYTTDDTEISNVSIMSHDPVSGIVAYRYDVVTTTAVTGNLTTEILDLNDVQHDLSLTNLTLTDLQLEDGQVYYLAVQTSDLLGQWSEIGYSQGFVVDTSLPDLEFGSSAEELVTNTGSLDVAWRTNEPGKIYYRILMLDADGQNVTNPDWSVQTVTNVLFGTFAFEENLPGMYKLEMYQVDLAENQTAIFSKTIRHNFAPYVHLYASELSIYQGRSIQFTLDADDADGTIVEYHWMIDDETVVKDPAVDAAADVFVRKFSILGDHVVSVTVVDNNGATATTSLAVTVTNTLEGELTEDEVWSGHLQIRGDVEVPTGITLTIEPGARIEFFTDAALLVHGTIQLEGEAENPVILTRLEGTDWKGIAIHWPASVTGIAYVHLSHAERGLALLGPDSGDENEGTGEDGTPETGTNTGQSANTGLRANLLTSSGKVLTANQSMSTANEPIMIPGIAIHHVTFEQNAVGLHLYQYTAVVNLCNFTANAYFGIKEDLGGSATVTDSMFRDNGLSAYYDEIETWLDVEQLNQMPGNSGNTQ